MNKKLIVFLSIALIIIFAAATGITYAWLTSTGNATIEYTVGDVSYTVTGNVQGNTTVVPGENLTNTFTITNNSNVTTNLRVAISTTYNGWTIGEVGDANTPNKTDQILVAVNESGWESVEENGVLYFYYGQKADTGEGQTGPEDLGANTNPSSFPFSEFRLNGYTVGNEHSGKTVTITITFYAKQADYVTWDELGSVNFTTGLAN